MKKILIIEGDKQMAICLESLIMDINASVDVHGPLYSISEVINELTECNDYDMIISSVQLCDGDVFEAFKEVTPQSCIVFTSSHDEQAMDRIKSNLQDYLINTAYNNESLLEQKYLEFERPIQQTGLKNNDTTIPDDSVFYSTNRYRKRFLITKGEDMVVLNVEDINYISIKGNHVLAHTDTGIALPLSTTMADLEHQLSPKQFFRLNRQYIASVRGIHRITLHFCSRLKVWLKGCTDEHIIISKAKATSLRKWLEC